MDGRGDINLAKQLRDSFSKQKKQPQRPNRKHRMQQAAAEISPPSNMKHQNGLRSVPRGDHSFQFGRGVATPPARSDRMPPRRVGPSANPRPSVQPKSVTSPTMVRTPAPASRENIPPSTNQQQAFGSPQQFYPPQPLQALPTQQFFHPPRDFLPTLNYSNTQNVLQDRLVNATNQQSSPKRVASGTERNKDAKRIRRNDNPFDLSV